jgi:hypothetical protein
MHPSGGFAIATSASPAPTSQISRGLKRLCLHGVVKQVRRKARLISHVRTNGEATAGCVWYGPPDGGRGATAFMETRGNRMKDENESGPRMGDVLPMPVRSPIVSGSKMGRIVGVEENGLPLVEFEGSDPVPARVLEPISTESLKSLAANRAKVLLTFQGGDHARPVIAGDLGTSETPEHEGSVAEHEGSGPGAGGDDSLFPECLILNGDKVDLAAAHEVTVKCGPASLIFRRNHKVIVRGTNVEIGSVDADVFKSFDIRVDE